VVARGRRLQPRAGEKGGSATGPSPVDRARNGSKHHLLVDATGIPLAWALTGGNRNDITRLIPLLDAVPPVRGRVGRPRQRPDRVIADRAYDHRPQRQELRKRGVTAQIARRQSEHGSGLGRYRWVVERTFGCSTSSSVCSSATTAAPRSTKRSSHSAAASSASRGSSAHCDSSSKVALAARPQRGVATTSQGHPRTIFRRALEHGNLMVAEATAREVGQISLNEALELTALAASRTRHTRVAARWLGRYLAEHDSSTLEEVALVVASLSALLITGCRIERKWNAQSMTSRRRPPVTIPRRSSSPNVRERRYRHFPGKEAGTESVRSRFSNPRR